MLRCAVGGERWVVVGVVVMVGVEVVVLISRPCRCSGDGMVSFFFQGYFLFFIKDWR